MTVKESLKPLVSLRVMDLVAEAGINVKPWSWSKHGNPVKTAASNPAYCYDWAFIEPGRLVVLNLWYRDISEDADGIWSELNIREWADTVSRVKSLAAGKRNAQNRRAVRMDSVIAQAFEQRLPIRVIVGEGSQEDITNPEVKKASRMKLRRLDPEPWSIRSYDSGSGGCVLFRGLSSGVADQFGVGTTELPKRVHTSSQGFERDREVRDAALMRAKGKCEIESCRQPGFIMDNGKIYLETHHVIYLSEDGWDHERNVAALCPSHHREAHYGERRSAIREDLLLMLDRKYDSMPKVSRVQSTE